MALAVNFENQGQWQKVYMQGQIDEDAEVNFGQLLSQLGTNVIFNFRGVESVNSCGVRGWINFLRDVEQSRKVIFEECTPEIVSQINMIPNFKGNAEVRSVYAPYSCESCGHQQWRLFAQGQDMPKSSDDDISELKCQKCADTMEMEELEDEFFAWVDAA